jgi:hypothetical protein
MKRTVKRWIITAMAVPVIAIAVLVGIHLLLTYGVIPYDAPGLPSLTHAGIDEYRSYVDGGLRDSICRYAFSATREQILMFIESEGLTKTSYFECDEQTSRNRLHNITKEHPYWFKVPWRQELEHYADNHGPGWHEELVYDPSTGQCLLKIWAH